MFKFPWAVVKKAFDVGLMNLGLPQQYGGPGLSILESCLIQEELSYGCSGIQQAISGSGLGVLI